MERMKVEESCASSRTSFLGQRPVQPHRAHVQTVQRGLALCRHPLSLCFVSGVQGEVERTAAARSLGSHGVPSPRVGFQLLAPLLGTLAPPVFPSPCCAGTAAILHPRGHGQTRGQGGAHTHGYRGSTLHLKPAVLGPIQRAALLGLASPLR